MDENARKTEWDGIVRKCPNCGVTLSSMAAFCPECGHELSERQSFNNDKEISEKNKRMKDEFAGIVGKKIADDYDYKERDKEIDEMNKKIISYISSFPIPNTVENISELMLYAVGNAQIEASKCSMDGSAYKSDMLRSAWMIMVDRCYSKAKLSFDKTKEFAKIARLYKSIHKAMKRGELQANIMLIVTTIIAIGVGFGLRFIFGNIIGILGGRIIGIVSGLLVWYPVFTFISKTTWPKPILHR